MKLPKWVFTPIPRVWRRSGGLFTLVIILQFWALFLFPVFNLLGTIFFAIACSACALWAVCHFSLGEWVVCAGWHSLKQNLRSVRQWKELVPRQKFKAAAAVALVTGYTLGVLVTCSLVIIAMATYKR
jgi:hypothetical protein